MEAWEDSSREKGEAGCWSHFISSSFFPNLARLEFPFALYISGKQTERIGMDVRPAMTDTEKKYERMYSYIGLISKQSKKFDIECPYSCRVG